MNGCKMMKLEVFICSSREKMGIESARYTAELIEDMLTRFDEINMVFAAAPSQNEFLHYLSMMEGIEWKRINAFHLDEYLDLPKDAPQRFSNFLDERIFKRVPFKNVYYVDPSGDEDPEVLCERYEELLRDNPIHIACIGIGENGHVAFNEPSVADFNDPRLVKIVELEEKSRIQQVKDGCFERLEDVPKRAITMTIPAIMMADHIVCVVPGERKSDAVKDTLEGPVSTDCPASVLRRHPSVAIFLDEESAKLLGKG